MEDIKPIRRVEFIITSEQAEKIVADYISERMLNIGYKLTNVKCEDGPWPDTYWYGVEAKAVEDI